MQGKLLCRKLSGRLFHSLLKPFNEEHLKSDGDQRVAISPVPFSLDQLMATLTHFALEREDLPVTGKGSSQTMFNDFERR